MDTILQGVPGAMCYIDDILVTGATEEEHLQNLEEVLCQLQAYGIRMTRSKCYFMWDSVTYLGNLVDIDAYGIRAFPENIAAIAHAPMPRNVEQLRSFLGLQNYTQIDKEALAPIYGVRKFHNYLYGPKKKVPSVAAAWLQRWALLLAAYDYDIDFRSTSDHSNADALSQLPLPRMIPPETWLCNIHKIKTLPVTSMEIRTATQWDPTLSKVKRYFLRGWPEKIPKALLSYHYKIAELSVEDGCLLWGGRVIIPPSLREKIKAE